MDSKQVNNRKENMTEYKIKAVERNEWFFKVKANNKKDAHEKAFKTWEENAFSFEHMQNGKTDTYFEIEESEQ